MDLWYKWAVDWIYFSPHLDDVALSCGGLLWEQAVQGAAVSIWTICAGEAPGEELSPFATSLHARWGTGSETVIMRRLEDAASCREIDAQYRHLTIPDCIYRRGDDTGGWLYDSEEALFGSLHADDSRLAAILSEELAASLPEPAMLVCPLAIGGHVDHLLTRAAVEQLVSKSGAEGKWLLWYYADYPYVTWGSSLLADIAAEGWTAIPFAISQNGLAAWGRAVAAHRSQISTFWADAVAMQADLQEYALQSGGVRLWRPIKNEQVF